MEAVYERLELLAKIELDSYNAVDLVEWGCCDPVRLFVKQEPHPQRKISSRRFRLISSVSVVDQIVERILFGYQNRLEIATWETCPSKPGMGLAVASQAEAIWKDLYYKHTIRPAAEADISGFDWSVQEWELMADVEMRIRLGGFEAKAARAARNRFKCLALSVFQLSDGRLISQSEPGLMKSGSYCTSSSNSRIRCLMAKLIDAPWCIAMGDDSVEGFVPDAREKYKLLGHDCKDYVLCAAKTTKVGSELVGVNFCSHFIGHKSFYLTSWCKTLFKYLASDSPEFINLEAEMHGSPVWPRVLRYLRRVGLGPDKIINKDLETTNGKTTESEFPASSNYTIECNAHPAISKEESEPWKYFNRYEDYSSSSCPRFPIHSASVQKHHEQWPLSYERNGVFSAPGY